MNLHCCCICKFVMQLHCKSGSRWLFLKLSSKEAALYLCTFLIINRINRKVSGVLLQFSEAFKAIQSFVLHILEPNLWQRCSTVVKTVFKSLFFQMHVHSHRIFTIDIDICNDPQLKQEILVNVPLLLFPQGH